MSVWIDIVIPGLSDQLGRKPVLIGALVLAAVAILPLKARSVLGSCLPPCFWPVVASSVVCVFFLVETAPEKQK